MIAALALVGCVTPKPAPSLAGDYLSGHLAAKRNAIFDAADAFADAHQGAPGESPILKSAFFFNLAAGEVEAATPLASNLLESEEDEYEVLARVTLAAVALKAGRLQEARGYVERAESAPFLKSATYLVDVWIENELNGPQAALDMLENTPEGIFKGFNPLHVALIADEAGADDIAQAAHQVSVFGLGGPVGRAAYGAYLERTDAAAAREFYTLLMRERGVARRTARAGIARLEKGAPSRAYQNLTAAEGAAIALQAFGYSSLVQIAQEHARLEKAGFNVAEPRYNLPLTVTQIANYLDPSLHEAKSLVGQIYNAYEDIEAAQKYFDQIPARSPSYESARIYLAAGLASAGRNQDAIAVLKTAVARDANAIEAQYTLADLYVLEERYEDAVAAVDTVLARVNPETQEDSWRYFVTRGGAHLELGDWEAAERDLIKAVDLAPEESRALNALGYRWVERGENLDRAFDMIEKAVALDPESAETIDSLGWAYYQRGQYQEAVGHLELAAKKKPEDPILTDHLGDVYWRLQRETEARYQWRRVLELDASEKLLKDARRKIETGLSPADATSDAQ